MGVGMGSEEKSEKLIFHWYYKLKIGHSEEHGIHIYFWVKRLFILDEVVDEWRAEIFFHHPDRHNWKFQI